MRSSCVVALLAVLPLGCVPDAHERPARAGVVDDGDRPGVAEVPGVGEVPGVPIEDPCAACPTACHEGRCAVEAWAEVGLPVGAFTVIDGVAYACSGVTSGANPLGTKLLRIEGTSVEVMGGSEEVVCSGAASDHASPFVFFGVLGDGVYRAKRAPGARATRIHADGWVRDVATQGGEVLVARGEHLEAQFAGLRRMRVGGAEIARDLAFTDAPGRPPDRVKIDPEGRVYWSIGSTEEILLAPSLDARASTVLLDGRGEAARQDALHDFAVVGDEVIALLDDVVIRFPRERPWDLETLAGVPGGGRLVADGQAVWVAWWRDDRVERIGRDGSREDVATGVRDGLLALDGPHLYLAESAGSRILRVVR